MGKAYRYVALCCSVCKNRKECYNGRRIARKEAIDYGTLQVMANCPGWTPEKKNSGGDK